MKIKMFTVAVTLLMVGCFSSKETGIVEDNSCEIRFTSSKGLSWIGIDYLNELNLQDIRIRVKLSNVISTKIFINGNMVGRSESKTSLLDLTERDSLDIHYGLIAKDTNGIGFPNGCYEVRVMAKALNDSIYDKYMIADKSDSAWFKYYVNYQN